MMGWIYVGADISKKKTVGDIVHFGNRPIIEIAGIQG